jgi:hypothetical protein
MRLDLNPTPSIQSWSSGCSPPSGCCVQISRLGVNRCPEELFAHFLCFLCEMISPVYTLTPLLLRNVTETLRRCCNGRGSAFDCDIQKLIKILPPTKPHNPSIERSFPLHVFSGTMSHQNCANFQMIQQSEGLLICFLYCFFLGILYRDDYDHPANLRLKSSQTKEPAAWHGSCMCQLIGLPNRMRGRGYPATNRKLVVCEP